MFKPNPDHRLRSMSMQSSRHSPSPAQNSASASRSDQSVPSVLGVGTSVARRSRRAAAVLAFITLSVTSARAISPLSVDAWSQGDSHVDRAFEAAPTMQIGGSTLAVAVKGDVAYVGIGPRLTLLDVSDPTAPSVLGRSHPLPDLVAAVEVAGDYAYLAAGPTGGLRIFDVSAPTAPRQIGVYDSRGGARDLALQDGVVYLADGAHYDYLRTRPGSDDSGVAAIDVSDPSAPVLLDYLETPGHARQVSVDGDLLVLVDSNFGVDSGNFRTGHWYSGHPGTLEVVDISDPQRLQRIETGLVGLAGASFIRDDIAYTSSEVCKRPDTVFDPGSPSGICAFDLTEPGSPSRIWLSTGYPEASIASVLRDDLLYTSSPGHCITVIDLSDDGAPERIGSLDAKGQCQDLDVVGDYAFLAGGSWGLLTVDVSDPAAPTLVGSYLEPSYVYEVAPTSDRLYVATYDDVWSLEPRGFDPPVLTAKYSAPEINRHHSGAGLAVGESRAVWALAAVFGDVHSMGLPDLRPTGAVSSSLAEAYQRDVILDRDVGFVTSVSQEPDPTGSCSPTYQPYVESIMFGQDGTGSVIDRVALTPCTSGFMPGGADSSAALNMAEYEGFLFVAAGLCGVGVVDGRDPTALRQVNLVRTPFGHSRYAFDVAIWEDVAYVVGDRSLSVLDISRPTVPRELQELPYGHWVADGFGATAAVHAGQRVMYVTQGYEDVVVYDIAVPREPTRLGTFPVPGTAVHTSVRDNSLFVSTGEGGLWGWDVLRRSPRDDRFFPYAAR